MVVPCRLSAMRSDPDIFTPSYASTLSKSLPTESWEDLQWGVQPVVLTRNLQSRHLEPTASPKL